MADTREDSQTQPITLQSIWDYVQELEQAFFNTRSLNSNNIGLTGVVNGYLKSPDFVSGSKGWQLSPDGTFEGNNGTFRGSLVGNSFQTATTGTRVRILSSSGITPTQSGNSIAFIDSSNNILGFIGTGYQLGAILTITPMTDVVGAYFYDATGVALSGGNPLVSIFMQEATSAGRALSAIHGGTGVAVYASNIKTGTSLYVVDGTQTSSADLAYFQCDNTSSNGLHLVKSGAAGYSFYIEQNNTTSIFQCMYLVNKGPSIGLYVDQNNAATTGGIGIYINQRKPQTSGLSVQGSVSSTHFYKLIDLQTFALWASDGTTPNGNLSGNTGDWCIGGDSGKPYYCTGTTNWTVF